MGEPSHKVTRAGRTGWWRLSGIFFEPTRTFQEIDRRQNWLLPVLATIAAAAVNTLIVFKKIGLESILRGQVTRSLQAQELSEEQLDALIETLSSSLITQIFFYLQPIVPLVFVLLSALLFTGTLHLIGAETRFVKVLSVNAHTFFFYYFLYLTLTNIVILFTQDPRSIDLENPLRSNLGFALSRTDSPVLYRFASSVDVLSFYHTYLLALGLSIVSRNISFPITLGVVGALWATLVFARVLFATWFF